MHCNLMNFKQKERKEEHFTGSKISHYQRQQSMDKTRRVAFADHQYDPKG